MAKKPETTFIQSVHKYLPIVFFQKNNNAYVSGCFDVWYSGDRADLWVEYKFLPKIPPIITPALTPLQLEWGDGRLAEQRNVAVVVGSPKGGVVYTNRFFPWHTSITRECFLANLITRKEIAAWVLKITGTSPCKLEQLSASRSPSTVSVSRRSSRLNLSTN